MISQCFVFYSNRTIIVIKLVVESLVTGLYTYDTKIQSA